MISLDNWEFTTATITRDGTAMYRVTGHRKDARQYDGSPSPDGYGFILPFGLASPVTGEGETIERAYAAAAYQAGASDGRSDEIMARAQRTIHGGRR